MIRLNKNAAHMEPSSIPHGSGTAVRMKLRNNDLSDVVVDLYMGAEQPVSDEALNCH